MSRHAHSGAALALGAIAALFASARTRIWRGRPSQHPRTGDFFVGIKVSQPDEKGAVTVSGQSYVGFAKPAKKRYPYPLVLIHGGGGQSTDWFSTVDGRDGWRNYFVADGIDTYWFDRPGLAGRPRTRATAMVVSDKPTRCR